MPETSPVAIRSPWRTVAVVTSALPVSIGAFVFAPLAPVLFTCFALMCASIALAYWRMELRCDSDGFVVCNGLGSRRIAWSDVDDVTWGRKWPWGPSVLLQLRGGRSVALAATYTPMAAPGEGRSWVERIQACRPPTSPPGPVCA